MLGIEPLRIQAVEAPKEPTKLEPVIVTSTRIEQPLIKVPAAIGIVEKEDIQLGQQTVGLEESLEKIPGLLFQNRFNFAQDLRISIRGFGARAGFGIRGIKILLDGIPETLPDGQGNLDSIDLGSAERIEVIRGPVSSLYGNASGGVISVFTESGPEQPFLESRVSLGEFGFQQYRLKSGGEWGVMNYLVNLTRLELDGWREHSGTENILFNSKFQFTLNETSNLTALVNFVDTTSDSPGGLTQAQVDSDRRQASSRNLQFDAGEEVNQERVGMVYRNQFTQNHELTATTYYTSRSLDSNLPFQSGGAVDLERFVVGGGVKYIYSRQIFGKQNRLVVGIDLEHQNDDRQRFNNDNGKRGSLTFDQTEKVSTVGPFIQNEFSFLENLTLTLGGRYDRVQFEVEDHFLSDGDNSGDRTLDKFSPRIGLLYSHSPSFNLYGNISTTFETPTTTEFANPSGAGGFNPDLEPMTAVNYEVGVKGGFKGKLHYELAVFTVRAKDELIPFQLPDFPGRTFYQNAGKSTRNGMELGLRAELLKGLTLTGAYTYSDFFFEEFRTADGVFDDNQIPGIPRNQIYGEIAYFHPSGLYGVWNVLFVDEVFVDNANTVKSDAYTLSDLRLGYMKHSGNWEFSPFIGLNNLFDEEYNANVIVNAGGGRFFEPAPGFNVYGGIHLGYSFF